MGRLAKSLIFQPCDVVIVPLGSGKSRYLLFSAHRWPAERRVVSDRLSPQPLDEAAHEVEKVCFFEHELVQHLSNFAAAGGQRSQKAFSAEAGPAT